MSLYLVPKCGHCKRLFPQFGRPDKWGAENAMRERLRECGWQSTLQDDYCPECLREMGLQQTPKARSLA